jgi:hypothetical protein
MVVYSRTKWLTPSECEVATIEGQLRIMHQRNQATIDDLEVNGWFKPICKWLGIIDSSAICHHLNNPFRFIEESCYPSGCPIGWFK